MSSEWTFFHPNLETSNLSKRSSFRPHDTNTKYPPFFKTRAHSLRESSTDCRASVSFGVHIIQSRVPLSIITSKVSASNRRPKKWTILPLSADCTPHIHVVIFQRRQLRWILLFHDTNNTLHEIDGMNRLDPITPQTLRQTRVTTSKIKDDGISYICGEEQSSIGSPPFPWLCSNLTFLNGATNEKQAFRISLQLTYHSWRSPKPIFSYLALQNSFFAKPINEHIIQNYFPNLALSPSPISP